MDADRFDTLSKSLATRFSRRGALRTGGAGLAATVLAGLGFRSVTARQASSPWYTIIRRYPLSGSPDAAVQELTSGFLPLVQQASGYVQYTVVASTDNTLTTITVFESQAKYEAAAQDEAAWVQQNLASLLPAAAEETTGGAVVYDVNADLICGSGPAPTAEPTAEPTEAPCTGIGCTCNGGVQGACDEGLVCCQSQMGGGPIPGGAGMCAAEDACGDGDATPVT